MMEWNLLYEQATEWRGHLQMPFNKCTEEVSAVVNDSSFPSSPGSFHHCDGCGGTDHVPSCPDPRST
ncbi:hypothetical protein AV530_006578 [Patagioenas fasciata monilis]|uniref:Uncharacterized protein n=1 Tax=Patagioenas fasciata monilis TaxID=372326 RepID=A0A1V4KH47_PATFA|nr:hypothetical protein AV530_006578 [Patagioenas fasciata monilis]